MTAEANEQSERTGETGGEPGAHRAIVREIHRELAMVHGIGGTVVLLVVTALLVGAWWWGWIWSPVPWLVAVVLVLTGLIVTRMVVYRRADRLHERLMAYCEANALDVEALRAHYRRENLYPFFERLFELKARRERLARGEPIDGEDGGDEGAG